MKVWWCEEHKNTQVYLDHAPTSRVCGVWLEKIAADYEYGTSTLREVILPCRMVEMQLVPGELQCPNCKFVYEVAT